MKESCKSKLIRITLMLIALLMFFQPAFGEDLSEEVEVMFKGKIFGDQLMLLDSMGRKSTARDGIYTTENGTKITVKNGTMIDIPSSDSIGTYSSIHIVDVEYSETD
jgi:hypothetical protein